MQKFGKNGKEDVWEKYTSYFSSTENTDEFKEKIDGGFRRINIKENM